MYRGIYDHYVQSPASRREILEAAFHADAQHPARRAAVDIGLLLLPVIVIAAVTAVLAL